MKDIKLFWDNEKGMADIAFANNDLVTDISLETAVLISLFCNARAADDDELPDKFRSTDRGGYWGDDTSEKDGDRVGSKLWLLSRAKSTQENLDRAKKYAEDALAWLIEEGIAVKVEVTASVGGSTMGGFRIDLRVDIFRKSGEITALEFESAWEALFE